MLKLNDIRKSYKTFDFSQTALDGVSIAFRDNEFAAVLGPSGSGKTTMLNIIGGLDQYDSGDLEIDNISTKKYKDRDWDTYRNNRIGFVFQSYNLIPHQTVLSNVELALTLSGVSKAERKTRAKKALDEVGLSDHIRKKPSQLSGGQMQRVAIARALINDPEILLADEPTGALDTQTSTQVMDLLTKIAKDRLVIMVTHNSELAETYANRIVHLKDGQIVSDSSPFDPKKEKARDGRKAKKASMSLWTAIALSFSNLMTKKGRTLITALAGSIGIIGIAAILALANGIDEYINNIEEETLSLYPLTIQTSGFDFTSILTDSGSGSGEKLERKPNTVLEQNIVDTLFSYRNKNDLASLKRYFDNNKTELDKYVNTIQYTYDITPQIYLADTTNSIEQVNPDSILDGYGMNTGGSNMSELLGLSGFGMNVFSEMPGDKKVYEHQYDILAGKWPQNYNEVILVLSAQGTITDFELYSLGLRDRSELKAMLEAFMNKEETNTDPAATGGSYSYDTIMSVEFKVVNAADYYQYDDTYNVWVNKASDKAYMKTLINNGIPLKIVGIAQPTSSTASTSLSTGINYTPDLINYLMVDAASKAVVKDQRSKPSINVLTGKTFAEEQEDGGNAFDFSKLISVDEKALEKAFNIDLSGLNLDFSNMNLDESSLDLSNIKMPTMDIAKIIKDFADLGNIKVESIIAVINTTFENFLLEEEASGTVEYDQILIDFADYIARSDVQQTIINELTKNLDPSIIQDQIMEIFENFLKETMQTYMTQVMGALQKELQTELQSVMAEIPKKMQTIDKDAFAKVFKVNMSQEGIYDIMKSLMNTEESTYDRNLTLLGYADPTIPSQIKIYSRNFEAKQAVKNILDRYNDEMVANDETDKVIHYTDLVGAMMSSVTNIVNMVSFSLIAFVSISLVVSSIMIGVITYISVLERKKEIGILRAIGASKKNIRRVFNAETLIVGFVAGVLGVTLTLLISVIANIIVLDKFKIANIAQLPLIAAVALVIISMILTYVAGLLPASAAARKDPVEALRSE